MKLLIFLLLSSTIFISCVKDRETLIERAKTPEELKAEKNKEKKIKSYKNLAMESIREKNYPEAYENLFKAVKIAPGDKELHNLLGLTYLYDGKEERAVKEFKKAIEIDGNYSEAHNHLGIVYSEKEEFKKAEKEFKKALDNLTYKTPWIAYTNLGRVYLLSGKFQKAIKTFKRSLSKNSRQCIPYQSLAELYRKENNFENAEINYLSAIKYCLNPEEIEKDLALMYIQNKKYVKAKEELEKCIKGAKLKSKRKLLENCKHYMNLLEE